ncbi:MAG: TolC family protein [Elusimicrobiota bacterium]|jgi:outer membrane protein TolC|nr:TolC family protein [Elusimicrobiota bacterium]
MKKRVVSILVLSLICNLFFAPAALAQASSGDGIDLFKLNDAATQGAITIEEAVNMALAVNTDIQIASKNVEIYEQQVRQYWSYVYPSISLSGSYTRALRAQNMITSMGSLRMNLDNSTSGTAEASLLLWAGGAVKAGIKIGDMYSQSGHFQLDETKNKIKDLVTMLCYGIVLSHALIQVQQENLNIAQDHLKEIKLKYKQGLASDLDILNQEVKVSNSEPPLIKAKNDYELGILNLKRVLNKNAEDDLKLKWQTENVESLIIPQLEALYDMARENRPELVIVRNATKIAEEQIKVARADHFGQISAFVNATYTGSSNSVIIPVSSNNSSYGANAGIRLSIPLFEGFRVNSIVKQKQLAYDQSVLLEKDTERTIQIAVKQARLNFEEAKERVSATRGTIKQARTNLDRTTLRYRNGLASRLDLDDSSLLLHDAELQFVQAVHDVFTALSNLNYAVGKEVISK